MNFRLIMGGRRFGFFDEAVKYIYYSASNSDYIVTSRGFKKLTPSSPSLCEIKLTGSSKKAYCHIVLDMDMVMEQGVEGAIFISPDILGVEPDEKGIHYWAVMGALFKVMGDISPAYVTGYLLEKNMKKELDVFTSMYNVLPAPFQAAVGDFMQKL